MDKLTTEPVIASPGVTRHILKTFNLRPSKRLGQNFLIDPAVVQDIVAAGDVTEADSVLEIGPGIGTLTQAIARTGANVTAVELDKKLPAVLAVTLAPYKNVKIVPGDILKINIAELMENKPFKVVANLPYYITTPILMTLLEKRLPITQMVTMVQKEVAERMVAVPGGKDYGALTVALQYFTIPEVVCTVPPRSFFPAPEVESCVLTCHVRDAPYPPVISEEMFFRVVRGAFGQRRKTVANALKGAGFSSVRLAAALEHCNIAPSRRGETLSAAEFAALADALGALPQTPQGAQPLDPGRGIIPLHP